MAALHQPGVELCDLRSFTASDLNPLLTEETEHWRATLDWDFKRSADLVRKFTELRALNGAALVDNSGVIGYAYSVLEEHKGLIGDLYVRHAYRTPANEYLLLSHVLDELTGTPFIRRVESQLILFGSVVRQFPLPDRLRIFERDFLEIDCESLDGMPAVAHPGIAIEPWASHHQEAASHLIVNAYSNHVDALINDQYRSLAGARRFLYNIVQYPGCGSFLAPASLSAFDRDTGSMCGMCLASVVGPQVGHVTQVCLSRDTRGKGLGYEMLRQSIRLMELNGCRSVTLTVTSANRVAMDLYKRLGFRSLRKFPAFVWEGF